MSLGPDIIKKLNRKFEPTTTSQFRYRTYDVVVQSDDEGNAVMAFIGSANDEGIVKGDRYSRVFKKDKEGKHIKDHWEKKGKAS
jgi:hypothetical protein